MKRKSIIPIIPVCLCLLLACQQPASHQAAAVSDTALAATPVQGPPDTTTLRGGWFLQPVLASDTATGKTASLRFDTGKRRFTGNTGCNNISGEFWFSDKDSSLSFSDKLLTTKMACPGYNEKAFIQSLVHTTHYHLNNGILILLSDNNAELSRWGRQQSVPAKTNKA